KKAFFCQNCGQESPKWIGKCPSCGEWNTCVEEIIDKGEKGKKENWKEQKAGQPQTLKLSEIEKKPQQYLPTDDEELNRVLGGGIVPGSLVLVAGEPGIGKSTLFLQNGLQLQQAVVLYISGEESEQQIRMRS